MASVLELGLDDNWSAGARRGKNCQYLIKRCLIQALPQSCSPLNLSIHKTTHHTAFAFKIPILSQAFNLHINATYQQHTGRLSLAASHSCSHSVLTLSTKDLRLASLSILPFLQSQYVDSCFLVDMANGVFFSKPICPLTITSSTCESYLRGSLKRLIGSLVGSSKKLLSVWAKHSGRQDIMRNELKSSEKDQRIYTEQIHKYLKISFMELGVSDMDVHIHRILREEQLRERQKFDEKERQSILKGRKELYSSLLLFAQLPANDRISEKIKLSQDEIINMEDYLRFPQPRVLRSERNQFLYSEIVVKDCQPVPSWTTVTGGTSDLDLVKVAYKYCLSEMGVEQKYLMLKSPRKGFQSYLKHQKSVLQTLNDVGSAYLVRYYAPEKGPLKGKLLMDYCAKHKPLAIFKQTRSISFSFLSKVIVLANITNGLRFLKKRDIVHMDLNPNNVLVNPNLTIKIIDFGEAFSSVVGYDQTQPGFTNPFGPPEVLQAMKQFHSKQDIFSLGIITFYLMFSRLPFNPTEKLKASYRDSTYHQKFFFAVQELEYVWMDGPMKIILSMVMRMMSSDQVERPYATWMRVIFKMVQNWLSVCYLKQM